MHSAAPTRPRFGFILTITILGLLYAVYLASAVSLMAAMRGAGHATVLSAAHELPESDFALFWYAGKLLLMRAASTCGVHLGPSAWQQQTFPVDILAADSPFTIAWPYPPPMGLLAMPFSLIPLPVSFWVWRIATIAAAGALLRRAGLGWPVIAAGLAGPAGLHDMVGGQNGALTGALLVAALLLIGPAPRFSGVLAGLLCIKPQVAMIWPLILLRRQRAKALAACLTVAAALSALSLAVEGWQAWVFFFTVARADEMRAAAAPFSQSFPAAGITVFIAARSLHASVAQAWAMQALLSLAAMFLIWLLWRKPCADATGRMACTVCLAILVMPHGFAYDLVAFSIAMATMAARCEGWQFAAFGILWLMGGYTITVANFTGLIVMPVFAAAGAWLAWRQIGSNKGVGYET